MPADSSPDRAIRFHGDEEGEPKGLPFIVLVRNDLEIVPGDTGAGRVDRHRWRPRHYAHCLWLSWMRRHLPEQHSLPLRQWVPFFSQQRPLLHFLPLLHGQVPLHGLFAFPV